MTPRSAKLIPLQEEDLPHGLLNPLISTMPVALFLPCPARSKSFPVAGNSYKYTHWPSSYFQHFADGLPLALTMPDEVARNGVLQRITSARGFL